MNLVRSTDVLEPIQMKINQRLLIQFKLFLKIIGWSTKIRLTMSLAGRGFRAPFKSWEARQIEKANTQSLVA